MQQCSGLSGRDSVIGGTDKSMLVITCIKDLYNINFLINKHIFQANLHIYAHFRVDKKEMY